MEALVYYNSTSTAKIKNAHTHTTAQHSASFLVVAGCMVLITHDKKAFLKGSSDRCLYQQDGELLSGGGEGGDLLV